MRPTLNQLRRRWNVLAVASIVVALARVPSAFADLPASAPALAPQTQPSPVAVVAPESGQPLAARVLVLPFQTVDGRLGDQWIARSIQQSILSDLMTSGPMPVSTAPSPAADPADAGRRAGARYVIDSLIHLNPAEGETAIRVTGQVISTETGQPIAAVKATGTLDNLFALEDDLGAQFRRRLNQVIGKPTPPAAEAPPEIPFSGPVTSSPQQRYPWYDYGAPHNVPPDAMERYYYQVPFPNGFPYYDSGAAYPPYSYYPGNYGYPFFTSGVFFSHRNDHVHHQIGSGGRPIGPRGPTLPPNSGGHPRRR